MRSVGTMQLLQETLEELSTRGERYLIACRNDLLKAGK